MNVMIGRYKVCMEETRLVLTHKAGIRFDLTLNEVSELLAFISIYQSAIKTALRKKEAEADAEGLPSTENVIE